jgi:hypothetical protein
MLGAKISFFLDMDVSRPYLRVASTDWFGLASALPHKVITRAKALS